MTLIPAREQGLPWNRLEPLDRLVPPSREPTDADSTTPVPYVPSAEDAARQRTEQPGIAYTPDAADAAQRQAVADYETSQ